MNPGVIQQNRILARKLVIVAVGMLTFAFALSPIYQKICEVTGIAQGRVIAAEATRQMDNTRWVTVELIANNNGALKWKFEPLQKSIRVHPGQIAQVEYMVTNTLGRAVTAQAVASYGPENAGQFFKKIECFCFKQQSFAADEIRRMPVVFVVSPELPSEVGTVTLSYTFFDVAADAAGGKG